LSRKEIARYYMLDDDVWNF